MNREEQVEKLTTYIAHFTDYIGKHLPDDVKAKISELARNPSVPPRAERRSHAFSRTPPAFPLK